VGSRFAISYKWVKAGADVGRCIQEGSYVKKLLVAAAASAMLLAGAGLGRAQGADPTGPAKYGLCKAYFAGSQTGQDHKHAAPPFQNLEQAASDANQSVADFCSSATPGGK
jgi:hypothetical protein